MEGLLSLGLGVVATGVGHVDKGASLDEQIANHNGELGQAELGAEGELEREEMEKDGPPATQGELLDANGAANGNVTRVLVESRVDDAHEGRGIRIARREYRLNEDRVSLRAGRVVHLEILTGKGVSEAASGEADADAIWDSLGKSKRWISQRYMLPSANSTRKPSFSG